MRLQALLSPTRFFVFYVMLTATTHKLTAQEVFAVDSINRTLTRILLTGHLHPPGAGII